MEPDAVRVARDFWERMVTNDFRSVVDIVTDDFELTYPQTGERFTAANMVLLNEEYPSATGRWKFTVNTIVGDEQRAVTDVTVTDGDVTATAVTFFTVEDGRIRSMTEYWPDPYDPPPSRAHLRSPG